MDDLRALLLTSAAAHADRPALWVDDCLVSYRELIHHGLGIANALISPRRTAVFANRHYWSYAGIVGAVLAGHAFVPLNPRHPTDRLAGILEQADVGSVVIDSESLKSCRPLLETMTNKCIVVPDADHLPDWVCRTTNRYVVRADLTAMSYKPAIETSDGAYLLFTSGSTGSPKGVLVNHENVTIYLRTMQVRYGLTPDDRTTQLFDLTFDLAVHDLFVTWEAGATLYCPSDGVRRNPRAFVRQHALTSWFSTPSTIAFMARMRVLRPDDFPSLRWSLFCGEPLPKRLVEAWALAAPHTAIENLYGPTEATIAFTVFRVPFQTAVPRAVPLPTLPDIIPIGVPLTGQQATIQAGELCLAGSQVVEGYWRQPALTAERFISDGTRRWYHTGDRVVIGEYGLEFLGRLDRQVKISGHRVELQEVETVLRAAAACDSVAALAWPLDADGLAHGIVALVAAEGRPDDHIIAECQRHLAPYMMPSRLVRLADWPLNLNGKTDYRALLASLS